ncbi:L,D-transpeptidase [Nocardioides sp. LML1-1-1.1]|uniref:L,D-transpeptidase n=1 Tax=Nocardioides sp. LML1-1-1.1 TaxID=3135248 RepID=UPI003440DF8C
MGAHRATPQGRHRAPVAGKRRAVVRPRYGRIAAFGASVAVTAIAVAGGFGLLPPGGDRTDAASALTSVPKQSPSPSPRPDARSAATSPALDADAARMAAVSESTALPAGSGKGRRIVFSQGRQRVWLIDGTGDVERTYLVSGSVTDNLARGTFAVYSRSRNAVGIDDSGTMEYFVRFTHGTGGSAIGFHTIPVDDGKPVQTLKQLGTPLSHGCIRQERSNAIALWEFAPIGTKVVVTA